MIGWGSASADVEPEQLALDIGPTLAAEPQAPAEVDGSTWVQPDDLTFGEWVESLPTNP